MAIVLGKTVGIGFRTKPLQPKTIPANKGKITILTDDAILSENGFAKTTSTKQLILNIMNWFRNQPSKILAYANHLSIVHDTLKNTLEEAGHTWQVAKDLNLTLSFLQKFDVLFLIDEKINNQLLTRYVDSGGHILLVLSTRNVQRESRRWNEFLQSFGLKITGPKIKVNGLIKINNDTEHQLLQDITKLFFNELTVVSALDPFDAKNTILENELGQATIITYENNNSVLRRPALVTGLQDYNYITEFDQRAFRLHPIEQAPHLPWPFPAHRTAVFIHTTAGKKALSDVKTINPRDETNQT